MQARPSRYLPSEIDLLRDIVARRRPEVLDLVARVEAGLEGDGREQLRALLVDELCERLLPGVAAQHRDLELEDLIAHLGGR